MDSILQFILENPITTVFLMAVAVIGSLLSLTRRGETTGTNPEDIVPFYKRFDRREIERGDRRKSRQPKSQGEERRHGGRRGRD